MRAAPEVSRLAEDAARSLALHLAWFVEAAAAVVVGVAAVRALYRFLTTLRQTRESDSTADSIRLGFGRSLALALEFELAADVLKTVVAPSWNDIGLLAAIAILRTGLNYFLERELRGAERRDDGTRTERRDGGHPPGPDGA